ncbi:hypothetical protein GCM10010430_66120 [Kitasatospora cystarginea]|uniref:Uncharacterized protein n=1 Tax=Kitasatospora cystarginea TaxID=58350 RepID=A0ABP5RQL7_9ACTN
MPWPIAAASPRSGRGPGRGRRIRRPHRERQEQRQISGFADGAASQPAMGKQRREGWVDGDGGGGLAGAGCR